MNKLIVTFRDFINDSNYVVEKYKNIDDKDKWSCICSCMDWIEVSIEYIKNNKERIENKNYFDMEVFAYISSINLISESIQQLYRVFYNTKNTPFKSDNYIFKDSQRSDDEYFAHIRAVFGAHPTNLDPLNRSDSFRSFASYPNHRLDSNGFSVILYTNKVNEWGETFNLSFEKLNFFLEKRYNYLNELMKKIEKDKFDYISNLQSIKIEKKKCIVQQLYILKEESKKRLNLEYNNYLINRILELINFEITNPINIPIIKKYIEILKNHIDILYKDLQTLNFNDIEEDIFSSIYSYHYTKILEGKFIDYDILKVKESLKKFVIIDLRMSWSEIKSLSQIGMYFLYKENTTNTAFDEKITINFLDDFLKKIEENPESLLVSQEKHKSS